MFFRVIYFHWPNVASTELQIIQCLGNFADSRRSHRETWAHLSNGRRVPTTVYFIEAPDEAATILKLKGFYVDILPEEPSELVSHDGIFIPDLEL